MTKLQNLIKRIKNKEYRYIVKRISLYFIPYIYGRFYIEYRFKYNLLVSTLWTKYLKLPKDYSYILAGSHGVGFAAFIKYFQIINANPMTLDNLFFSIDYVLLAKKYAKKYHNQIYGLSFDKAYKDKTRKNILLKFNKKVPIFMLVRDPISIIRTHTHYYILPILINGIKSNEISLNMGGG